MKEGNIDIMMTQETRMAEGEAKEERWSRQHPRGMKVFTSENLKEHRKAGVATFLNKRVSLLVRDKVVLKDEEGRLLAIPIRTLAKGVHIWVINIYAPANTQEKKNFWKIA